MTSKGRDLEALSDSDGQQATRAVPNMPFAEFIILMALLMSLVALSTDAILPSLEVLGQELGQSQPQKLQQVVTILFAGLAIGQLLYGPLSDQIGRKNSIYCGLALFLVGCVLSWASTSFEQLLMGRFLQGFGVAGPRIVLIAMIRDMFVGRAMARTMSFIMGVFIFVPAIAPIMGQWVAQIAGWRAVFFSFVLLSVLGGVWLAIRQKETLRPEHRIPFTPSNIWQSTKVVFSTPSCVGYMIAAGIVAGPFIFYLSTAQDLFQRTYGLGDDFPYYFAGLALSIGLASFLNSRFVMKFGMRFLARTALIVLIILASLALILSAPSGFVPELSVFLILFSPLFFCIGILFGNMNALAMEDVGEVAGPASAWVGTVSTLLAMGIATLMGMLYDGSILALGGSFAFCGLATLLVMWRTEVWRKHVADRNA